MKYYLRKSSDISKLFLLDREIFPEDYTLDFCNNENWILYKDGKPIGFCSLKVLRAENFGFFSRAGVIESERGKKLHRRLIRVRLDQCKKLNLGGAITYIKRENAASGNSLISMGFKMYSPQNEWADEECIYFRKDF